jgi:ABC-type uncharacterized transport system ATPase subunit
MGDDVLDTAYIKLENITKTFGSVFANRNINLSVSRGEIHSLLGENGSGKSTLMNVLSGIYSPDSGSVFIDGEKVSLQSPAHSIKLGIGMIHQHFKLIDDMTAIENVILGTKGSFALNKKVLSSEIKALSSKFGLEINPDKMVYNMSVGEKQTVEILKVLYRGARILILDEPTAVLTPQEVEKLFNIMRKMKQQGCAVIIITHKLYEVMEISDRVTVLRKGESIGTVNKRDTDICKLTEMMVGRPIELSIKKEIVEKKGMEFEVKNLTAFDEEGVKALDNVSFSISRGEILGVAGVSGSGQKELCECIAGLHPVKDGEIIFEGESIVGKNPREIIKMGISMSFIPEDRLGMGLIASMDIVDNILLKSYSLDKSVFLDRKLAKDHAEQLVHRLEIKTPGVNHPVRLLSGGNIQKVLLGREIESNPHLLITAYPVRGLDIGASYTIYDLINDQKKKEVAILFIGEDLDVLMELCDRIMVICDGKVMGIVDAEKITKSELGLMMAGEAHIEGGLSCDFTKVN